MVRHGIQQMIKGSSEAPSASASVADYLVAPDMGLVQIDLPVETPEWDTYFIYPEELKDTKRITVFRDFIVAKAKEWSF